MQLSRDFSEFVDACSARGVRFLDVDVDGRSIPVIGREALIANKRATGRLQALADVERLEADPG